MKNTIHLVFACFFLMFTAFLSAQTTNFWSFPESKTGFAPEESLLGQLPGNYQQVELDLAGLYQFMADASNKDSETFFQISLPTPEGNFAEFLLLPTTVVASEVAHLYSVQTFKGYAPGSPLVRLRCDVSSSGFHAVVYIAGNQTYVIEPLSKISASSHLVYYKRELPKVSFSCEVHSHEFDEHGVTDPGLIRTPTQKRTYRLAIIADPNYQTQFGGMPYDVQNILNSFASGVNMINEIYERDMGVSFELVSNEACAEASGISFTSINQVHSFIVAKLGVDGFDIGHSMVWSNTGGAASKGVVCNDGSKGRGFSGNNSSFVTLYVDYGAHEIGHQMGADHTFVSQECGVTPINYRFEPGQGSTIMAYAGLCGASYQNFSDPYLHSASIAQMHAYLAGVGSTCGQTDNTGNANAPSANAQNNITIPRQTPFVLVGVGSDADGDPITFDWQQFDGSGSLQTGPPNCNSINQPLFRIRLPQEDNFRVFPEMSHVLAGNNNGATFEKLPCVARTMNFRLQVRDNNFFWGRTAFDDVVVNVADTGPFNVSSPNGGELLDTDIPHAVTWTVNGTDGHCSEVDILLSTDNGNTYSSLGTYPNSGSGFVNFPHVYTGNARLLIQCSVGGDFLSVSTFFDVSDATFSLTSATNPPDGGQIAGSQTVCSGDFPDPFISLSSPSGFVCELEYQWQISTSNLSFVNIAGAVSENYTHTGTITQTTWFRRLANVPCELYWLESNTIEITLNPAPVRMYVTVSGAGIMDGSNWANAYSGDNLQTAINNVCKEVWVAAGTYKPTTGSDREISFQMKNGVAIYGGFEGTEDPMTFDLADRNFVANETILSGDIGTTGDNSDNSYSVVYAGPGVTNSGIIDGFTISGASGSTFGGGMLVVISSPTINNCTFTHNSSSYLGGGICSYVGSPVVTNSIFSFNNSVGWGGGFANAFGGSPIVANCVFMNNHSSIFGGGGGIYSQDASMTITNCTFSGNSGSALHCNTAANVSNCIFWENDGVIFNATVGISNCIVQGGYLPCVYCPGDNGNVDPLFVNSAEGNLRLQTNSPAIDAGNNAFVPSGIATDLDGNPRISGSAVDMGAYEFQAGVTPVSLDLSGFVVGENDNECFGATQNITIQDVSVDAGGSLTLIAGNSITITPDFNVAANAYFRAYISDEYCILPASLLALESEVENIPALDFNENLSDDLRIFPNPTTGSFTIQLGEAFGSNKTSVSIYSLIGELILTNEHVLNQAEFNLSGYSNGIYVVIIRNNENTEIRKLIKQ